MLSMHFLSLLTLNHMLPSKHNNLPNWPNLSLVLPTWPLKKFQQCFTFFDSFCGSSPYLMKAHKVKAKIKLTIITFPTKSIWKKHRNLTYFHSFSIRNPSTSLTSKCKLNKIPNSIDNSPSLTYFHLLSTTQLGRLIVFCSLYNTNRLWTYPNLTQAN
jgi:hypothetical protein